MVLDYIITNLDKIIYTLTLILLLVVIISYKSKRLSIDARISWLVWAFFFLTLSFGFIIQFIKLFPESWGYYSDEEFITYNEALSILIWASLSFSILNSIHFYFEYQIVRFAFFIFPIFKFYMVKRELKRISMKDDSSRLKNIIKHSKWTLYQYHVLKCMKNTNDCRIKVLALIESYYSDKTLDEIHPEFHSLIYQTKKFEKEFFKK